jgi:hypothetical protein
MLATPPTRLYRPKCSPIRMNKGTGTAPIASDKMKP